ncbi:MAG: ABC transporter permease [bacterium]
MKSSLILLFLILIIGVLPIAWMFGASVWSNEGFTLKHYAALWQDLRALKLLGNTIALGLLTVAGALSLSIPLAFLMERTNLPLRNVLGAMLLIPLFLPPYTLAVAWSNILGRRGLLHQWLGIGDVTAAFLHSFWGCAFVLTLALMPIAILFIQTALTHVHAEIEEAARLEASRAEILLLVTLPLIAPALLSSGILIFVLVISEFAVPMFLGVNIFTTEIFTQFAAFYNYDTAVAMSLPLVVMTLAAMTWERARLQANVFAGEEVASRFSSRLSLGRWRFVAQGFCWLIFVMAVMLPMGLLLAQSLSLVAYRRAFDLAENGLAISLTNSAVAATLLVVLGFVTAYCVERQRAQHLDSLLLLLFAIPSTVLGIGLIHLWNQKVFAGVIYNTAAIVIIAYLARFFILTERMFLSTFKQIPMAFEEAARMEGASTRQVWANVLFPLSARTVVAAWIIAFIFCFGELATTIMVYPAGGATLPIRLYTIMANSPENVTAAMSIILILPILLAVVVVVLSSKFLFARRLI